MSAMQTSQREHEHHLHQHRRGSPAVHCSSFRAFQVPSAIAVKASRFARAHGIGEVHTQHASGAPEKQKGMRNKILLKTPLVHGVRVRSIARYAAKPGCLAACTHELPREREKKHGNRLGSPPKPRSASAPNAREPEWERFPPPFVQGDRLPSQQPMSSS